MRKIPEFLNYFIEDCLDWDSSYTIKAMFSWYWIYKYSKIFAIYAMWELYFKVWENNIEDFKKYNSKRFEYQKKWKLSYISYYTLPEEILENRNELENWINNSLKV